MAEIDAGGQIAMFQKLLNSPLGALGKSMTGNPVATSRSVARGSASRSRRFAGNPLDTVAVSGNLERRYSPSANSQPFPTLNSNSTGDHR